MLSIIMIIMGEGKKLYMLSIIMIVVTGREAQVNRNEE